jgi:uncharacterized SAM-binding protein YcdF (DUF218 family)
MNRAVTWLVRSAAAFGFLFAVVTFLPILDPWVSALSAPWSDSPGDTLIVLGGDTTAGGVLGLSSYWRAVYAVFEWRRGGYREIVISGAAGVAESMGDFVVAYGVPRNALRVESRAQTTREHALFLAEMLRGDPGRKILLTSDYHSRRAWNCFRKVGLDVTPRPFPDARKRAGNLTQRWPVFLDLSLETAKTVWYRVKGWI